MPKKYFPSDHKKWLEEFDDCKTERELAKKYDCDIRSIRKGIGEARRARDLAQARIYLVREALQKHHEDLVDILNDMNKTLKTPPENLEVARSTGSVELPIEGGKYIRDEKGQSKVELSFEGKLGWKLVKEHLPWRHPLITEFHKWKRYLKEHIDDRFAFKDKLVNLLEEETGYKISNEALKPPFIYRDAVPYFYGPALKRAHNKSDETNPEKRITIDTDNNRIVSQGGTKLAKAPRNGEETIKKIQMAYFKLLQSTEFQNVDESFARLVKLTIKLREQLEETRMLRLFPNECRVCKQIGI